MGSVTSRARAGYVNYNDDVDSDWLPDLFTLKITTAQQITISTENTLALVVPWILLANSFFVHSLELLLVLLLIADGTELL
jgi:hypothetical protein